MTWNSSTRPTRSRAPFEPAAGFGHDAVRIQKLPDLPQGQVKVDLPGPGDQIWDALAALVGQVPEWGSGAYQNQQPRRLVTFMAPLDAAPSVDDGEPFGVASRREEVIQQNAAVVCIGSLMLQRAGVVVDERAAAPRARREDGYVALCPQRGARAAHRDPLATGFATACPARLPGAGSLCSERLARRHLQ